MTPTTYQLNKYERYFQLLDTDKSGTIDWNDFAQTARFIRDDRGWTDEHAGYKSLLAAMQTFWTELSQRVDTDGNGQVDRQEWQQFYAQVNDEIGRLGKVPAWAMNVVHGFHRVLDLDGDGSISLAEYELWLRALGATVDASAAFKRLDLRGTGRLEIDELEELYSQWVMSNDPSDPGNVLVTGESGDPA
ncbi:Calerythrin [Enhygromyxa salina]|uniref:Calerythrin n=1 Tax=Enhygromyxa salina TaxID=215803 RepID=A0A2S9XSN4_9BACT|nr:EF-hand domain-containing protein [Enhygromyxa salina]PRP95856.1 Calerythrin [Enhygromyxa salina]